MWADRADYRVPLEELAASFARHLCEHLKLVDKQATSRSSKFLEACRAFNHGELSEDVLIGTAALLGFADVVDAFHLVGSGPVHVRFFADERGGSSGASGAIRLTDDPRRPAGSMHGTMPAGEAEVRWRLVETARQLDLARAGIAVQADAVQDLLLADADQRIRRTSITQRDLSYIS
jgi:hypothetical protein